MDGPFRPNRALDRGTRLAEYPAPDNLVWQDDHLLFTSGKAVLLLDIMNDHDGDAEEILRFESPVTAMAAAADGSLAVGLESGGVAIVGGAHDGKTIPVIAGKRLNSPTALCFADPHTLFVCVGSEAAMSADWRRDVKPYRAGGGLWRIDLNGDGQVCLADNLGLPSGLLLRDKNMLVLSEASRNRALAFSTVERRAPRVLLDDLPGYPGRLATGSAGSTWLTIFSLCPRSRILRPSMPPDAYGLVIQLSEGFEPEVSLHGQADGRCRGVSSCLQSRGELIIACREDNALISIDLTQEIES
jgi:hypothetical protein